MNFTESCESVSELSYVICPHLFKRRNESYNFSQDQAERISTSSQHPGGFRTALTGLRRNIPETVTARANCARNDRHSASDACAIALRRNWQFVTELCADFGRIDKVRRL